jgi:phosphoribosylanthranilate isomerase
MALVKICGINSEAAFGATVEAGADYLGFVFFPHSPRAVTPAQAASLCARHTGGPKRVGLFVNPTPEAIAAVLAEVRLDILQIYGNIPAGLTLPVWRALGAATHADLPAAGEPVDGYVVEAKPPPGATRPGGNAVTADWTLLSHWQAPKPWLLAGGLTPRNVAAALAQTGANGADVSSGVETAPGVKSPELIKEFIKEVAFLKKMPGPAWSANAASAKNFRA